MAPLDGEHKAGSTTDGKGDSPDLPRDKVQKWLNAPDPPDTATLGSARLPGTGKWFIQGKDFRWWKRKETGASLVICGECMFLSPAVPSRLLITSSLRSRVWKDYPLVCSFLSAPSIESSHCGIALLLSLRSNAPETRRKLLLSSNAPETRRKLSHTIISTLNPTSTISGHCWLRLCRNFVKALTITQNPCLRSAAMVRIRPLRLSSRNT